MAECTNRSGLIQSNHHRTECSNLLVHSPAANRHLAGYMAMLTNIISSYKKTEQFIMTTYQLKNDKYQLSTFAATGPNDIKLQVGISTCNYSSIRAVLLLFRCGLSHHNDFLPLRRHAPEASGNTSFLYGVLCNCSSFPIALYAIAVVLRAWRQIKFYTSSALLPKKASIYLPLGAQRWTCAPLKDRARLDTLGCFIPLGNAAATQG